MGPQPTRFHLFGRKHPWRTMQRVKLSALLAGAGFLLTAAITGAGGTSWLYALSILGYMVYLVCLGWEQGWQECLREAAEADKPKSPTWWDRRKASHNLALGMREAARENSKNQ